MVQHLLESFTLFFTIIDPIGILPIFIALTYGQPLEQKKAVAFKATVIATVIFIIFAVVGDMLLTALRISESAFRIAGGVLLLLTAIDMVLARHTGLSSTTKDEEKEADQRQDISVFPLAVPLIAGPGGLVAVTIQMREAEGALLTQFGVIGMLVLVLAITYILFYLATPIARFLGVTGANVLTRVLGIILSALAVQFIIDGIWGQIK